MSNNIDELNGFRKLYEFSRSLLTGDDPESLLNHLVEATQTVTDADEVLLFEIDDQGDPVVRAMGTRRGEPEVLDGELPDYSRTLVEEVVARGEPLLLTDVCEDPRFEAAKSVQILAITSAIGAPLVDSGKIQGIIYAARHRMVENFTEHHRDLLTVAASQASLLLGRLASVTALRESESRHRSLVEMSPSTIAVIQDQRLVFASKAALQLWKRQSIAEVIGEEVGELFNPWRSQPLLEALRKKKAFETVDAWVVRGDEDDPGCPVEVTGRPIQFEGEEAFQIMISEVGEKAAVLARRVRTDRLVVMGTMASTVGHEINNPLSYVYANIDYAVEELEKWWEQREPVEHPDGSARVDVMASLRSAQEGTERIRAVVESIQNFSRLEEGDEEPTTVARPLESSIRIAKTRLDPDVELQIDIRPTAPVKISAARLGQVFLNLLINAAQALESVPDDQEEDKRLEVRTREQEELVIIEIADNGPGITPEIGRHIFEPFVSTKSDESGTGLGLAICHDIVKSAGGQITVDSEPGKGSIFEVRLPAAAEPATQSIQMYTETQGQRPGRILVVDPDPSLSQSLQRVLQTQHEVFAVNTRGEAVELLSGQPRFDVILCDLRLRGGVGIDLFRWIQNNSPRYWDRLVAMTASQLTPRTREFLNGLPNPWVSKPFDIHNLRAIIGGLIDELDARTQPEEATASSAD